MGNIAIKGERHAVGRRVSRVLMWGALGLLSACSSSSSSVLTFVEPKDGDTFAPADDVVADVDGVQIDVVARTERLGGNRVGLLNNGELQGSFEAPKEASDTTLTATLVPGENRLSLAIELTDGTWDTDGPAVTVSLADTCGRVGFIAPVAPDDGSPLVLGGPSFCEEDDSQLDVSVAVPDVPDGTDVMLVLNGNVHATAQASGGSVSFAGVDFATGTNDMYVSIAAEDGGTACSEVPFPVDIEVDCDAPNCRITAPALGPGMALSSADDADDTAAGLQVDVVVETDEMANGENVTLVLDGNTDGALTAEAGAAGSGVQATFRGVTLAEGRRTVRATCVDRLGNEDDDRAEWNVDTQACGVSIVGVTPEPAQPGNVLATDLGSLEATISVQVTGDDCVELRSTVSSSSECAGVGNATATGLTPDAAPVDQKLDLTSGGDLFLCAQVRDDAGNNAVASYPVTLINGEPQLAISLPAGQSGPAKFNQFGTEDAAGDQRIADLNPNTTACEANLTVTCVDANGTPLDGVDVQLFRQDTSSLVGTAPCANGVAAFEYDSTVAGSGARLPSVPSANGYSLVARTEANGLTGESPPFNVVPDCVRPTVSWSVPGVSSVCGTTIRPSDSPDPNTELEGYQVDVIVATEGDLPATVYVQQVGDPLGSISTTTGDDASPALGVRISNVTLGEGGELNLTACSTDSAGNERCNSDCDVVLGEVPKLRIEEPADRAKFFASLAGVEYRDGAPGNISPSCQADPFSIQVTAYTDAPVGRNATVQIGAQSPWPVTVQDGTGDPDADVEHPNIVSFCAPAEGLDSPSVDVRVAVSAESESIPSAVKMVSVAIDTQAPEQVTGLAFSGGACRETPTVSWAADEANRPTFVGFDMHCDPEPITDEAGWDQAEVKIDGITATSATVSGARPAETYSCYVRAFDQAFAYSPLSDAIEVTVDDYSLYELEWPEFRAPDDTTPAAPNSPVGVLVSGVGDVNADGYDDFVVVGGTNSGSNHAYLYFGQETVGGAGGDPQVVRFRSFDLADYGLNVAPLGNFDGDAEGTDDFALSFYGSAGEVVYVVLGRESGWPTNEVNLDAQGCGVDVCMAQSESTLGVAPGIGLAGAGDFDGDGYHDLAIGSFNDYPIVVRGGDYDRIDYNGASSGTCVDIAIGADPSEMSYSPPVCWDGVNDPVVADGFVLDQALSPSGLALASSGQGELVVGSANGFLQFFRGSAYPAATSGLVSLGAAPTEVDDLASINMVRAIGDYDGDGSVDYGVASPNQRSFRIYFGSGVDAGYTLSAAGKIRIRDGAEADFPYDFRATVPGDNEMADLDGDGKAEFFLGDGFPSGSSSPEGTLDLGFGGLLERGADVTRNDAYASGALRGLGPDFPDAPVDPSPYPRYGSPLGAFDGDRFNDFVLLESNPLVAETGRLFLIGTCSP